MKILSPQMYPLLTPVEIVSGAAAALWLFLCCKCLQKRSGNLWSVCRRFQTDWWFNSRWLNILSSFCSQGGLRSCCHNSQWFIFSDPISLPGLVGLFIYPAWSLICQPWNTGARNGVLRDAAVPLQASMQVLLMQMLRLSQNNVRHLHNAAIAFWPIL